MFAIYRDVWNNYYYFQHDATHNQSRPLIEWRETGNSNAPTLILYFVKYWSY